MPLNDAQQKWMSGLPATTTASIGMNGGGDHQDGSGATEESHEKSFVEDVMENPYIGPAGAFKGKDGDSDLTLTGKALGIFATLPLWGTAVIVAAEADHVNDFVIKPGERMLKSGADANGFGSGGSDNPNNDGSADPSNEGTDAGRPDENDGGGSSSADGGDDGGGGGMSAGGDGGSSALGNDGSGGSSSAGGGDDGGGGGMSAGSDGGSSALGNDGSGDGGVCKPDDDSGK